MLFAPTPSVERPFSESEGFCQEVASDNLEKPATFLNWKATGFELPVRLGVLPLPWPGFGGGLGRAAQQPLLVEGLLVGGALLPAGE